MKTLYVLQQIGSRASSTIVSAEDLSEQDILKVYFCVQSENENEALAVANAVKIVHDSFKTGLEPSYTDSAFQLGINKKGVGLNCAVVPPIEWGRDERDADERLYVYLYASPTTLEDWLLNPFALWIDPKIFYIGKGRDRRRFEHINEAINDLTVDTSASSSLEKRKVRKIQEVMLRSAEESAHGLVRRVAFFSGEHADAMYSAVEHYLINHLYGVYNLTNKNRGSNTCEHSDASWMSRPYGVLPSSTVWTDMVTDYAKNGLKAKTQSRLRDMVSVELNAHFPIFPFDRLVNSVGNLSAEKESVVTNGTDASYNLFVLNVQHFPVLKVQLKASDKDTGVCINLRPVDGTAESREVFYSTIAECFFCCPVNELDPKKFGLFGSSGTYFKPFKNTGVTEKDLWFDIRDIESQDYALPFGASFFGELMPCRFSLVDALRIIATKIGCPHN